MENTEESKNLIAAFCGLRDVYRNCRKMLLSCDPVMIDERNYIPLNWSAIYGYRDKIEFPDSWLPQYVIRHFKPSKTTNESLTEILTIGAIPWRSILPDKFIPMCLASRLQATSTPNDIYFISVAQMFEEEPKVDGQVRNIGNEMPLFENWQREKFQQIVHTNKLVSVAVPLLEITNTTQIFERLINPIFSYKWP